jgi:hypothetical protein
MQYAQPKASVVGKAVELILNDGMGGKAGSGGDDQCNPYNCRIHELDD